MGETGLAGLELLEQKINRAADLIAKLQREKNEVERANKELKEKIESVYIENEELTKKLQSLKRGRKKDTDFDKTREEIANKIEEMLAKLEGINF